MKKHESHTGPAGNATIRDGARGEHGEPHWTVVFTDASTRKVQRIPGFTDFYCARSVAMHLVADEGEPCWAEQAQDWCEDQASRR